MLDKLQNDYFFKAQAIEKASSNINVRDIYNILDRDEATVDQTTDGIQDRKGMIEWVDKTTKFLDLYAFKQEKVTVLADDFRPVFCEQINAKKIIFTLDDAYVAFDIRGDNKLIFIEWEDMKGLIDKKSILEKIEHFRKRNLNVIDGLKSKLVREKLYPDNKNLAKARRKAE